MSRIIVFTNPAHDKPTEYIGVWCEKMVSLAKTKPETKVIEIRGKDVIKNNVVKIIKETIPQLVFFHGHGSSNEICGHDYNVLIKVGDNLDILKDKVVHALACSAGSKLGPELLDIGGQCFIGYKEDFKFVHLNKQTKQEQLSDDIAAFFLDPAFRVIESIIEGDDPKTAFKKSQKAYQDNLLVLMASKNPNFNTAMASRLYHDFINQIILGDMQPSLLK